MGIRSGLGKMVGSAAQTVGAAVSNPAAAKRAVLRNRAAYGIAAKGTRTSKSAATAAMHAAIKTRQMQVGGRIVGGAAAAVGLSSLGGNKKSYYNPRSTPKGSGRYA